MLAVFRAVSNDTAAFKVQRVRAVSHAKTVWPRWRRMDTAVPHISYICRQQTRPPLRRRRRAVSNRKGGWIRRDAITSAE